MAAAFDDQTQIVLLCEGASCNRHHRTADRPACVAEATSARRRPGPQQPSRWEGSGMLQTTSAERRAAGGDRPRSSESVKTRLAREVHRRNHIFVGDYSSAFRAIVLLQSPVIGSDQARLAPASRLSNAALKTGSESASTRVGLP